MMMLIRGQGRVEQEEAVDELLRIAMWVEMTS